MFAGKKNRFTATLVVIGALFLLIFLDGRGYLDEVNDLGYRVFAPFVRWTRAPVRGMVRLGEFFVSSRSIFNENLRLAEENASLRRELAGRAELERENTALREAFNVAKEKQFDLVGARVYSRDTIMPGDYIFVDAGTSRGVEAGMPAVSSSATLIGVVMRAEQDFSHVRLLADPSSVLRVFVESSRASGTVKGELGASVSFYPDEESALLEDGEALFTSGIDTGIPRGLFVGTVRDIRKTTDKTSTRASVSLPLRISQTEEVFIITNNP